MIYEPRRLLGSARWARTGLPLATLVAMLLVGPSAQAAGGGQSVARAVQRVLDTDVGDANYGVAKRKLRALLARCQKEDCGSAVEAQVHIVLAMIASQRNEAEDARSEFLEAVKLDPGASLPPSATEAMNIQLAEARKAVAAIPPPPAPHNNKTAYEFAAAAVAASAAGSYDLCIDRAKASVAIEEEPHTRLQLASCESRADKLLDALRDAGQSLDIAIARKDSSLIAPARQLVVELLRRIPHVRFRPPAHVDDLAVTFDGVSIRPDRLTQPSPVDPGRHMVHASGTVDGLPMDFDEADEVKDGDQISIQITLRPTTPKFLTAGQMQCVREAKSQEDVQKCLPHKAQPYIVSVGTDFSAYSDTTAVRVYSPRIYASVAAPTAGWNATASYSVDVVSAASPDIVSTASPPFHDVRQAVSASGGYKPGRFGAEARGSLSVESDYVSRSGGVAFLGDFDDKLVTPRIAYNHNEDTIGRAGTPFSFFSHEFRTDEFEAAVSLVLSPTSLLVVGGTAAFERGDQSKPYRLVPVFDPTVSEPVGASVDQVNRDRLPVRPYEQLPLARDRYALAVRYVVRRDTTTIRLEERLYRDTWQQMASTSDVRLLHDFGPHVTAGPHLRVNVQDAADFYHRTYHALVVPELDLPVYRTTDRELSPLLSVYGGGTLDWTLSPAVSKVVYSLLLSTDVMYTHFFDALYITNRLAVYGTLGFEVAFQ